MVEILAHHYFLEAQVADLEFPQPLMRRSQIDKDDLLTGEEEDALLEAEDQDIENEGDDIDEEDSEEEGEEDQGSENDEKMYGEEGDDEPEDIVNEKVCRSVPFIIK